MHVIIIGAGVAGLAAAYDLCRAGHTVTVYEAADKPGGLAAGFRAENWDWALEKFYHHWFHNDDAVLGLIDELGHSDKVRFSQPVTSYYHERGTFVLDKPVSANPTISRAINVLSIPYLPLFAKLRLGAASFFLTKYSNGITLEKHTADAWSRRWMGQAAHALIWKPLLIAKFGALYDQVNMAWLWARIYKRTAQLGTYAGGFQGFVDDLAAHLREMGVTIHLGTPVERIAFTDAGLTVTVDGEAVPADQVLSTTSPGLMRRLTPDLPPAYAKQLADLKSIGALSMILALDRPLMTDGTYWLNLPAAHTDKTANPFPYLALVEHTNYQDPAHYGGDHIVYLGDYLAPDHPHFALSDEAIADLYLPSLQRVRPDFSREWIRDWWVFRAPYTQPVPTLNHSQNIPPIRTGLPGVYLANMSQVYPWDRGTNYAVEIGRQAAALMLADGPPE